MDDFNTCKNKISEFYKRQYGNAYVKSSINSDDEDIITITYKSASSGITRSYRVIVNYTDETIGKYPTQVDDFELFDMSELEFFDKLGFELDSTYQMVTNQNISDWWE